MGCVQMNFVPLILLALVLGSVAELKEERFGSKTDAFRFRYQHPIANGLHPRETAFGTKDFRAYLSNRRSVANEGETMQSSKTDPILSAYVALLA